MRAPTCACHECARKHLCAARRDDHGAGAPLTSSRNAHPARSFPLLQAAYSVQTVLLSLQTLLGDPNNASPLNGQAAQLWTQTSEYRKTVLKRYKEATGSAPDA